MTEAHSLLASHFKCQTVLKPSQNRCRKASSDLLRRTAASVPITFIPLSHNRRYVCNSGGAKHSAVALHFLRNSHRLGIVIRKLYRPPAIGIGKFAHQADRIKALAPIGIAVTKIIGQQRPPARAETDAPLRTPLQWIEKIRCPLKLLRSPAAKNLS